MQLYIIDFHYLEVDLLYKLTMETVLSQTHELTDEGSSTP